MLACSMNHVNVSFPERDYYSISTDFSGFNDMFIYITQNCVETLAGVKYVLVLLQLLWNNLNWLCGLIY